MIKVIILTAVIFMAYPTTTKPSETLLQTSYEITLPATETPTETILTPKTYNGFTEGEEYNMRIYHYCPCESCTPGTGNTASGKRAAVGMVAMSDLPFGTVIEINGIEYTVEDRGVGPGKVDIFVDGHAEALNKGNYKTKVKIIEFGGL